MKLVSSGNHHSLPLYLHEWMTKKSFTKANERPANHLLCHTDTCTSIRWDYPEEGLGLQAAVVWKFKSRFICSQKKSEMGTTLLTKHPLPVAISDNNLGSFWYCKMQCKCFKQQLYTEIQVPSCHNFLRLCSSSAKHTGQKGIKWT